MNHCILNSIFFKVTVFHNKSIRKRVVLYFFLNIIDIDLIKDNWILIPPSTFMLIQYVVLANQEICEENQV